MAIEEVQKDLARWSRRRPFLIIAGGTDRKPMQAAGKSRRKPLKMLD
jgi:hypothetical protein